IKVSEGISTKIILIIVRQNRFPSPSYRELLIPMAPPPSDPAIQRQKKGAPIKFLIPLIYAPVLPLVRLTLRHKPVLRDRVFGAVLVGAFAHGFYLVYPFFP
ncbi:SH3/FCH domain protein, partial [Perilla frutescens var. hirtella]